MKKILAWVMLLVLVVGLFAGCGNKNPDPTTEPSTTVSQGDIEGIKAALDYLKAMYPTPEEPTPTPRNYSRMNLVRIAGVPYDVVWTTSLGEDVLHVVDNGDGTATIEVLSNPEEDTPYTLTATITDAEGNSVSHNWDMILPKAIDMSAVVDAAYELANGETLPYEATLTGKIISIDTVYDPDYQNITVTIAVEGKEDKPIKCYRLKGEGAADLAVGNIITVTGTIKNYNGTIEFDSGCILEAVEKGDAVDAPTDPGEILKAAYALKDGKSLPYPATLTGKVIEIDSPYDPTYGNISVVIEVEGYSKYPLLCYRLKGTGVDQIAVNDTITVTGIIKNYKGTIEYDSGCKLLERISGGGVAEAPSSDASKILSDAAKLKPGEKLPYRATLTGTVYSVDKGYDASYGNVTVTMKVNGVKIQCYRLKGDGADLIRETDTITVSGEIENYNGKLEFSSGCTLVSWEKGPRNVSYGPMKEDVAYAMTLNQKSIDKVLYFNGQVSGSRLQTSDKGSNAIEVYVERVSGKGLRIFYLTGNTKNYIEIEEYMNDKGQARGRAKVVTEPTCYWTYLSDMGVYVVNLPTAGKYFLGTYNTYETITASWSGYLENSTNPQYVAKFIEYTEIPEDENTDKVAQGTPVAAPEVGVGYKFGFYQNQKEGKPFLAFNGKMAGYYYGTADVMADMVDVYLETAEGGYYLYIMNGNTKTYLDVVVRESDATKVDVKLQTSGTHTVYSLNTQYQYVYTSLAGSEWYLGTFGTNSSISASKTSYISDKTTIGVSQFCAWFNTVEEVDAPTQEPDVPDVPAGDATLITQPVANTAYKVGMNVKGEIWYLTGKTTDVSYRLAITTNPAEAADFYLEATDGGAYLYFMNGNTKTYVRVYHRTDGDPGYGKGSLELVTSAPSEVFGWSAAANTLIYDYDGNNAYYMGTYDYQGTVYQNAAVSNSSYISGDKASSVDVSQFPIHFYTVELGETPDVTEPTPTDPVTPPVGGEDLQAGIAYKWAIDQSNKGYTLYFAGTMNGHYGATTQNFNEAVDVVLETADGGYYISFTDPTGAKKYINVVVEGKYRNFTIADAPASVYTYSAEHNTLLTDVEGTTCYIGTWGDYTTFSVSSLDKIGTSFPSYFVLASGEVPPATEPTPTEPTPTEPAGTVIGVVEAPEAGVAYKFGMVQGNVGTDVFYITGEKSGYYMATMTDFDAAPDVYLEETDGGYYLYVMAGTAKKYVNMVVNGTHVNGEFENAPSTVYTYNAEKQTVVATVNDALYWFGTRNDNTYTTIGPVKVEYNGFYAKFYGMIEGETPDVTEPTPTEPVEGEGFVKITSAAQFTSGSYVMIVDTGYAPGAIDGTWLTAVQPVVSGNVVTDPAGGIWVLTVNGNSVTIADANGTFIAPKGGNNNGLATGASYDWEWSFADGKFQFAGTGSDTVKLASNSSTTGQYPGNHRFRGYKTTTLSGQYAAEYPHEFTLYKLAGNGEVPPATEPTPTEPTPTEPTPTEPSGSGDLGMITSPEAGKAYKLYSEQNNVGKKLYFAGTTANKDYYFSTTEDSAAATDVYLEATNGGYYLYFMKDGAKTYIDMIQSGTFFNLKMTSAPGVVYTFNTEYNTLVANVSGTDCYIGTYGTYETLSCSKISYISSSFPTHLEGVVEGDEPAPTEPAPTEPTPTEPTPSEPTPSEPSVGGESATYTFANYTGAGQYEDVTRELDEKVSVSVFDAHFTTQIRLYQDANHDSTAVFASTAAIKKIIVNAGSKSGTSTLKVFGSNNGSDWTEVGSVTVTGTYGNKSYQDLTFELAVTYQYIKLDAEGAQIRVPAITFTFA